MAGFKLFIDTQGKSVDEIKKGIRALLERRGEAPEPSAALNVDRMPVVSSSVA